MKKQNLNKFRTGKIKMEAHTAAIEKYLNMLWKNKIYVSNIASKDMTTFVMEIYLKDYLNAKKIADKLNVKIKIVSRKGYAFYLLKLKKRISIIIGVIIFISALYYLSGFIWEIDISGDGFICPYEIRQQLKGYGIIIGIRKDKFNVFELEQKLINNNGELMWVKIRTQGTALKVNITERQTPPQTNSDKTSENLTALKTGQVLRVYSSSGTAVVTPGDIVREGQILIKGEQGKEDGKYIVPAKGEVIAKTFYDEEKVIPLTTIKKERTGRRYINYYFNIKGKKYYLIKSLNTFDNYDKIIDNSGIIKKEIYYEINYKKQKLDYNKTIKEASDELYNKIVLKLYPNTKILDKKADIENAGDNIHIVMHVVAEENICSDSVNQ